MLLLLYFTGCIKNVLLLSILKHSFKSFIICRENIAIFLVMQSVSDYFQYTFGDIISFPKGCSRVKKAYKHFAVYVGTKNLFGQGEDKDIFHRISICII